MNPTLTLPLPIKALLSFYTSLMCLDGTQLEGAGFIILTSPCEVCQYENVNFLSLDRERIEVRVTHK
jgi:hypothetical protein